MTSQPRACQNVLDADVDWSTDLCFPLTLCDALTHIKSGSRTISAQAPPRHPPLRQTGSSAPFPPAALPSIAVCRPLLSTRPPADLLLVKHSSDPHLAVMWSASSLSMSHLLRHQQPTFPPSSSFHASSTTSRPPNGLSCYGPCSTASM